jgi:glyoxylase-like metal-dependent hydrolase (beta-lactamase superfamily II)
MKLKKAMIDMIPIKLSVTTCYLVRAEDQYVLVDTGYEEDWGLFCTRIKEAHVDLSQISHIVLTHHHDDHCGLLHNILRKNNAIRVVMSFPCKDLIRKGQNDLTHGGGLLNKRIAFLIKRKQFYVGMVLGRKVDKSQNLRFEPYVLRDCDILVGEDTKFCDIGIPLAGKMIETPGHTVDSISILFENGDCLVGDAAASMLRFAGTKNCVIFISDMNAYYKSWEKIIKAGALRIFPAHGKPFSVSQLEKNIWKNSAINMVK